MRHRKAAFTLIELLISVAIILTIVTIIFPFSLNLTQSFKENQDLEQLVLKIKNFQRKSYLYHMEYKIYVKENTLWLDNTPLLANPNISPTMDGEILIYPKGTSSGGTIILFGKYGTYRLTLTPLGEVILEK